MAGGPRRPPTSGARATGAAIRGQPCRGRSRFADRVAGPPSGTGRWPSLVAHDVAGDTGRLGKFDPDRAADLTAAAAVLSRTAQDRRPGRAPGPQRAGTGGAAAVFVWRSRPTSRRSALPLSWPSYSGSGGGRGAHRAVGEPSGGRPGQPRRGRPTPGRLDWSGYGQQPLVPDRARGATRTAPRPTHSRPATTREDGRDAGR